MTSCKFIVISKLRCCPNIEHYCINYTVRIAAGQEIVRKTTDYAKVREEGGLFVWGHGFFLNFSKSQGKVGKLYLDYGYDHFQVQ